MPADPDRRVGDHLSHLRADVDQVSWAGADVVRRRGDRRTRNHAVAGAMATLAVVSAAGFGLFGSQTLVGTDDIAGVPQEPPPAATETTTPGDGSPTDDESPGESSPGEETPESPEGNAEDPPDNTGGASGEPTETETPGDPEPTGEETTEEETSSPEMMLENTEGTLLDPGSMFPINDELSWSTVGTQPGETGTVSNCQASTLAGLGAEGTSQRDYSAGDSVTGAHVTGAFASEADAEAAYESLASAVDNCAWGSGNGANYVGVESGAAAWWFVGSETDDGGEFEVIGLTHRDNGVGLMVMYQTGMDYNENDPSGTVSTAWSQLES